MNYHQVKAVAIMCATSIVICLIAWGCLYNYFNRNDPHEPSKYEICTMNGGDYTAEGENTSDDFSCTGVDVPSTP